MALKVGVVLCFVSGLIAVYCTAKLRKFQGILIANGCHSFIGCLWNGEKRACNVRR